MKLNDFEAKCHAYAKALNTSVSVFTDDTGKFVGVFGNGRVITTNAISNSICVNDDHPAYRHNGRLGSIIRCM